MLNINMLNIFRRRILTALFSLIITISHAYSQPRTTINISLNKTYQTIDNIGASDAWSTQFVGQWPDEKKNAIADLLFSRDTLSNGTPKGIGLSLWRFNLGAGSTQQGNESGIKDEWRRAESFLNENGQFDWSRQAGQLWFLKAAKQRGVPQFLCFTNSPPVQFTVNGKAFASKGNTNLSPQKYSAFADYLATVISKIERTNKVRFNYVSPVNEPQWDWSDGGQEGCPFNNAEIAGLVGAINQTFDQYKITTKIIVPEAGSIEYLYSAGNKPGKGNQINDFFKPGSTDYIGNLSHVAKVIAAHSYFTTSPALKAQKMRQELSDTVKGIKGLKYWMSEYCILGDNDGEINGNKRDLGIDAALYMARVIHTDLTAANAAAWQWWTAISPVDYKDGLIYIDKNKTDGKYYTSKMLWVLGNYSRFVRPGAIRVDAEADQSGPLLISAYKQGKSFTAVIINPDNEAHPVHFNITGGNVWLLKSYTTSANKELIPIALNNPHRLLIEGRSVTTVTGIIN